MMLITAAPRLSEIWVACTHHVKTADQVDVHHDAETVRRKFVCARQEIAGSTGNENIDISLLPAARLKPKLDALWVADIRSDPDDLVADGTKRLDRAVDIFLLSAGDRNPGHSSLFISRSVRASAMRCSQIEYSMIFLPNAVRDDSRFTIFSNASSALPMVRMQ